MSYPAEADVRNLVQYGESDELTGSMIVPQSADVRTGIPVDDTTGILSLPTEAQVESGVQFGADGTEFTGTLEAGGGGGTTVYKDKSFIRIPRRR